MLLDDVAVFTLGFGTFVVSDAMVMLIDTESFVGHVDIIETNGDHVGKACDQGSSG